LSARAIAVIAHPSWKNDGWEPQQPYSPTLNELVDKGILRRVDGRCGFERLKDAFVKPTGAGIAAREALLVVNIGSAS
jgi:hypothetical protein